MVLQSLINAAFSVEYGLRLRARCLGMFHQGSRRIERFPLRISGGRLTVAGNLIDP